MDPSQNNQPNARHSGRSGFGIISGKVTTPEQRLAAAEQAEGRAAFVAAVAAANQQEAVNQLGRSVDEVLAAVALPGVIDSSQVPKLPEAAQTPGAQTELITGMPPEVRHNAEVLDPSDDVHPDFDESVPTYAPTDQANLNQ